ncbi:Tctex1 domain-containing protein 2 [Coemansia spiralis]|uniref:Tctex1 domain-containing protein 2 n=2 Tax=Coemansia TaxID=4863 RepID=A0A9W8GA54_9FUNG|nr:Tctex-1 [Coemansia spiralis]KAJ1995133.1 Tctex1 domain-containing protein 2 [Coemansia umbellata]KAJ2624062.1 Tctex1 domain-containing protein 2 [Coemansia sp. RSA 1358]KAJ2679670.1 Tctex1 domain-containing protein 2 [Coemansia spiralis]
MTIGGSGVRAEQAQKLRTTAMRGILGEVLRGELGSARYEAEEVAAASKRVGEAINKRLLEEPGMERYKLVANISIFQNDGQGARMGSSTVWDPETDGVVQEMFANDSIRCVAVVFAVCIY